MKEVFIAGEIGINHNGDMKIAKQLIDLAVEAGLQGVKFQKRTIDKMYTAEFLAEPRESPWGNTQRAQKEGLEFSAEQYREIDAYCKEKNIAWYASAWDVDAQLFLQQFDCQYNKVASAMLTKLDLMEVIAKEKKHTFIAVGMSTEEEISTVVEIFRRENCPFELMHAVSTYPMLPEEANLTYMNTLREKFGCDVGFSSHEMGNICCYGAVALGATSIERHITLDRGMYGSDQKASIEPEELKDLVARIRELESAMGDGSRVFSAREEENKKKLRG